MIIQQQNDEQYPQTKYGSIENYFSEGLDITADRQVALRDLYLTNN